MQISEIRARLPLSKVLDLYGWKPDGRGRMRCPFHDDESPSMQTYPETGTAYCFAGGCRTHGSTPGVFKLLREADEYTKHDAIL